MADIEQENKNLMFFEVSGYSMFPFYRAGDRFLVKKMPADNLKKGHIIAYYSGLDKLVCHRLIKNVCNENKNLFYTRGDVQFSLEGPIPEQSVIGKVVAVMKNGKIINLNTKKQVMLGRIIVFTFPILALAIKIVNFIKFKFKKNE